MSFTNRFFGNIFLTTLLLLLFSVSEYVSIIYAPFFFSTKQKERKKKILGEHPLPYIILSSKILFTILWIFDIVKEISFFFTQFHLNRFFASFNRTNNNVKTEQKTSRNFNVLCVCGTYTYSVFQCWINWKEEEWGKKKREEKIYLREKKNTTD